MNTRSTKPRLVFDFIRPPRERLDEIDSGIAPREMLLGFIQLRERGWPINISDDRWDGILGGIRKKLIFRAEIPSIKMIKVWRKADIIIITTRISLVLAIIAKLLGKKLVFLDAMCEEVPKRLWRRWIIKLALPLCDACICLSDSQAKHWANNLNLPMKIFYPVYYGVDTNFYKKSLTAVEDSKSRPYLLAVGRDPRRDFNTLVSAINILDWDLILVTQDYLVPPGIKNDPKVKILDGLSYDDLFKLYTHATVVVVPVKNGTTYMSGIRATMEAMLLEAPVVATRLPGMQDYFDDENELLYFDPENYQSLLEKINIITNNNSLRDKLINSAKKKVIERYNVADYASALENILKSI